MAGVKVQDSSKIQVDSVPGAFWPASDTGRVKGRAVREFVRTNVSGVRSKKFELGMRSGCHGTACIHGCECWCRRDSNTSLSQKGGNQSRPPQRKQHKFPVWARDRPLSRRWYPSLYPVNHQDWLTTFAAVAGDPDIKEKFPKGVDLNGRHYENNIDGLNRLDYVSG